MDADIFHRVRLHEKCAIEMRETVKSVKFRENRGRARVNSRDFRRLRLKLVLRGREGFFFAQNLQKNRNALKKNDAHLARAKNDRP